MKDMKVCFWILGCSFFIGVPLFVICCLRLLNFFSIFLFTGSLDSLTEMLFLILFNQNTRHI